MLISMRSETYFACGVPERENIHRHRSLKPSREIALSTEIIGRNHLLRIRPLVSRIAVAMLLILEITLPRETNAQVIREYHEWIDHSVPYNAPDGITYTNEVTIPGKTINFGRWYLSSGWRDMRFTYKAPDGTEVVQQAGGPWIDTAPLVGLDADGTWSINVTEYTPGDTHTVTFGYDMWYIREARTDFPISGPAIPELSGLDGIMTTWLEINGFESATIAVMRNKKLVYRRGYGWQDYERMIPTSADTVMRLASNTKPLTQRAIQILIDRSQLNESDKVYDVLEIEPLPGYPVTDNRVYDITIKNVRDHRSGFVRDAPGSGSLGETLSLGRAATLEEAVAYMWSQPLDFDPDAEYQYSNYGYQLLGAVVEKVSGSSYADFIESEIATPIGMTSLRVGDSEYSSLAPDEVWYAGHWLYSPEWDPDGELVEDSYAIDMTTRPGAGSLVCSAPDYCRYLREFFHPGTPKPDNLTGYSWDYTFYGSLPGTWTITRDTVTPDGNNLSYCVLMNERNDESDVADLQIEIDDYLAGIATWPDIDLFVELPSGDVWGIR